MSNKGLSANLNMGPSYKITVVIYHSTYFLGLKFHCKLLRYLCLPPWANAKKTFNVDNLLPLHGNYQCIIVIYHRITVLPWNGVNCCNKNFIIFLPPHLDVNKYLLPKNVISLKKDLNPE